MRVSQCGCGQVAGAGARQAGFGVDIHQQGEIGLEAAAGDAFQRDDGFCAEVAAAALVDQRGIREAVGEHDLAAVERGGDPLIHILRARGEIEQHFGGGAEFLVGGIEQDAADLHADGRAAGLGGFEHRAAQAAQAGGQAVHLGGLAGTIHAFEGDEETAGCHGSFYCNGGQTLVRTLTASPRSLSSYPPDRIHADSCTNAPGGIVRLRHKFIASPTCPSPNHSASSSESTPQHSRPPSAIPSPLPLYPAPQPPKATPGTSDPAC